MEQSGNIQRKQIHIVGGGTFEPIRNHLSLAAPAFGKTARQLGALCEEYMPQMDTNVHLTRMADSESSLETSSDLKDLAQSLIEDYATKVVFWTPAVTDFLGSVDGVKSSKDADRLHSAEPPVLDLVTNPKIVEMFRKQPVNGGKPRKDIVAVACKTTTGATPEDQYSAGLKLLKQNSLNLVLANDLRTHNNMIIAPEETVYEESTNRASVLRKLVEMVSLRSQLTFTESTVVKGEPVPWSSELVPGSLREVVDFCIDGGAYKPFLGVTAGHFAVKVSESVFLTSRRKTNFNDLDKIGLVRVETDGDDKVIAYGSKPSVGGQSQRIVFEQHPDKDCIVHFHCPIKPGSEIPVVSQWEYECGSHQCGENTSRGLGSFADGAIDAVYLDNHGPNLVFNRSIDPKIVKQFIDENFVLGAKTGGYIPHS